MELGPWFNIKMSSYQYRKSHCRDKTVVRSSYLHNGISYTGKVTSLYWIGALVTIGSGIGLWPVQYQAITWTNSDLLLTWHLIANFSLNQNLIYFSFPEIIKMSSTKCRPFWSSLNVSILWGLNKETDILTMVSSAFHWQKMSILTGACRTSFLLDQSSLVQVMAWRRMRHELLSKPIITEITAAYLWN